MTLLLPPPHQKKEGAIQQSCWCLSKQEIICFLEWVPSSRSSKTRYSEILQHGPLQTPDPLDPRNARAGVLQDSSFEEGWEGFRDVGIQCCNNHCTLYTGIKTG